MKYFVSASELTKNRKNALVASLLSIFFGSLGLHRYYLGRKLSGTLILLSTILTFGMAILFWIPFTLIEGLILLSKYKPRPRVAPPNPGVIESRLPDRSSASPHDVPRPPDTSVAQSQTVVAAPQRPQPKFSDIVRLSTTPARPHTVVRPEHDIKIYDVSNLKPTAILAPVSQPQQLTPTHTDWVSRLDIPYERNNLRIPQLREAVYELYEQLAKYIDTELSKSGSSLEYLRTHMPQDQYSHYNNLLYTIFCIAEGHVTEHYTGSRAYDNSFSYQLLERSTGIQLVTSTRAYALKLCEELPPANNDIKRAFGLTPSGFPIVWWDTDGLLRKYYKLSESQQRLLNITPPRSTRIFEIPAVRVLIYRHYLRVLDVLNKQRSTSDGWKVRISKYLDAVFGGTSRYVNDPYQFMLLNHILKLCEEAIREKLPYVRQLAVDKELDLIRRAIPRDAANAVIAAAQDVQEPISLSSETMEKLISQNPSAWKSDIAGVENKSLADVLAILHKYDDGSVTSRLTREILRSHPDKKVQLVSIYAMNIKVGTLDDWTTRQLVKLIHPDQLGSYQALVASKQPVTAEVAEELASFTKPPLRHVVLDEGKVRMAYEDHNHAVRSVAGYLGDDDDEVSDEKPLAPITTIEIARSASAPDTKSDAVTPTVIETLSDDQKEFLRQICETQDGYAIGDGATFAKSRGKLINAYIQAVNKVLYGLFEDQVIRQVDGKIILEQEYSDAVKEMI